MFDNWRFNPFTGVTSSVLVENEEQTIEYHSDWNGNGIQLDEAPVFETPSSVVIIENVTGGATFTEVPRTQAPSSGEYRVDYDADGYYGTGRVEFNAADVGKDVLVTYYGNGYVVKNQYQSEQNLTVPMNFNVTGDSVLAGDLDVTGDSVLAGKLNVTGDSLLAGKLNVDGDAAFSKIPTLPASSPLTDNDAVRKKYTDDSISDSSDSLISRIIKSIFFYTWTARAAAEANGWYSVTYGNNLFVAVSISGTNRVMTSPDGITWTARAAAKANLWRSVTYGNNLFVAVSHNGTNRVMTTLNFEDA